MRYVLILLLCVCVAGCKERKHHDFVSPKPDRFYRAMYASVVHAGNAYMIGGWTGEKPAKNDVWRLSDRDGWEQICSDAPWEPRCFFSAVSFGDYIYLLGGYVYSPPSNVIGDVWRSRDGVTWEQCADAPWESREHYGVVVKDGAIILLGGLTYLDPPPGMRFRNFDDVWKSTDGQTWEAINFHAPWGKRRGFSYGVIGDFIYLWAGWDEPENLLNDVWRSKDGVTWEQVTGNAPWCPRGNCHGCVFQDKLWVFGGCIDSNVTACSDVWSSADGATWTQHDLPPWDTRAGANPIVLDDTLLIISGFRYLPDKVFYKDIWQFDGDSWSVVRGQLARTN